MRCDPSQRWPCGNGDEGDEKDKKDKEIDGCGGTLLCAADAESWAKALKDAPAGRPVVRMGRPAKAEPKVATQLVTFRTDRFEKEALEALAEAQGRTLSDLLRSVTHDLVTAFKAGEKAARTNVEV